MNPVITGIIGAVCSLLFSASALACPGVAFAVAIPFAIALAGLLLTHPAGDRRTRP